MTAKLIIRKDRPYVNGLYPIAMRVTIGSRRKYYNTGLSSKLDQWNEDRARVRPNHPHYHICNKKLMDLEQRARETMDAMHMQRREETFAVFTKLYTPPKKKFRTVDDVFHLYIKEKQAANNYGGGAPYERTLAVLNTFNKGKTLQFDEIDYEWLKSFERSYQLRGRSNATIGFHLRHFRTIFNEAIKRGYISADTYPFRVFKLNRLKSEPRPLFLTIEEFEQFKNIELPKGSADWRAQQYFLFSAYARGMNYTDMIHLKYENIVTNRIIFNRSKTSVRHDIGINKNIQKILDEIEIYAPGKDGFIFPVLSKSNCDGKSMMNQKLQQRKRMNHRLTRLAKTHLNIDFNLTHGKARHTYANGLAEKGVDIRKIQQLMNHASVRTTEIYLAKFNNEELDKISENVFT